MTQDVNELIEDTLAALLLDQLDRHVADDERVGLDGGWLGCAGPGAVYPDVQHRLPQMTRPVGDSHIVATLGRRGGVRVTNRMGDTVISGVWIDGHYTADETPADS